MSIRHAAIHTEIVEFSGYLERYVELRIVGIAMTRDAMRVDDRSK